MLDTQLKYKDLLKVHKLRAPHAWTELSNTVLHTYSTLNNPIVGIYQEI